MIVMAVSGAAVLALITWVALRETSDGTTAPHPTGRAVERSPTGPTGHRAPPSSTVPVATVDDADTQEALDAAAALWTVGTR
jgi:hypothetical protein